MTIRRLVSPAAALVVAACALPFLGASDPSSSAGAAGPARRAFLEPTERGQVFHGLGPWRRDNLEHVALMDAADRPAFTTAYLSAGDRRVLAETDLIVRKFGERLAEEYAAGRFVHLGIEMQDTSSGRDEPIIDDFVEGDRYDDVIEGIARTIADHGTPVIVRPLFEFNSQKYLNHKVYVAGYRKVVDIFREVGADEVVAFCWCFEPRAGPGRFMDWYPGDDYVDWFGLDIFGEADILTDRQTLDFLREAERHDRPVFLAEVTCNRVPIGTTEADGKRVIREWFAPFAEFVEDHDQIKGFSYITTDYTKRGRYGKAGWLDSRLQNNPTVLAWWKDWMEDDRFVHALGCEPSWRGLEGVEAVLK